MESGIIRMAIAFKIRCHIPAANVDVAVDLRVGVGVGVRDGVECTRRSALRDAI